MKYKEILSAAKNLRKNDTYAEKIESDIIFILNQLEKKIYKLFPQGGEA